MNTVLMVLLAIASVVLIATILLQEGNSAGLSGSIAGGAEQRFGKQQARGFDGIRSKTATVCAVFYVVLSLVLVVLEK